MRQHPVSPSLLIYIRARPNLLLLRLLNIHGIYMAPQYILLLSPIELGPTSFSLGSEVGAEG